MASARLLSATAAIGLLLASCGSSESPALSNPPGTTPIAFEESAATTNAPPASVAAEPSVETAEERQEVAFLQFGGSLACPDEELRSALLFWAPQRMPLWSEADSYESFEILADQQLAGGFFGFSDVAHLGTYTMSAVAERPLTVDSFQRRVALTLGQLPAPVSISPNAFDNPVVLDCLFEGDEYTTFSAYDGDFECTEIDADSSFLLKERAPGNKIFLAWKPSNGPDYIMAEVAAGQTKFLARGIDTNQVEETVVVDFTFEEEIKDGRSRLTMSGELLYQDDPNPQRCAGEWDVWEPR